MEAYPRPLMRYTEQLYRHAFGRYGDFRLRENGEVLAATMQLPDSVLVLERVRAGVEAAVLWQPCAAGRYG